MDMESLKLVQFGKYRGKTFDTVYEDKDYCHWLLKTCKVKKNDSNIDLLIKYIEKTDILKNRKYDIQSNNFDLEYNTNKQQELKHIFKI